MDWMVNRNLKSSVKLFTCYFCCFSIIVFNIIWEFWETL